MSGDSCCDVVPEAQPRGGALRRRERLGCPLQPREQVGDRPGCDGLLGGGAGLVGAAWRGEDECVNCVNMLGDHLRELSGAESFCKNNQIPRFTPISGASKQARECSASAEAHLMSRASASAATLAVASSSPHTSATINGTTPSSTRSAAA